MDGGQGGGITDRVGAYVGDYGFWIAVVIVSVGVSLILHAVGAPGSRS
jgi:hypothetical protein